MTGRPRSGSEGSPRPERPAPLSHPAVVEESLRPLRTSVAVQVTGRLSLHPRGFGFLNFPLVEGSVRTSSAFIAPPDLNAFLADDVVSATVVTAVDGRCSASDLELISRSRSHLLGEIVSRGSDLQLRVDREVSNTDWPLDDPTGQARRGAVAVARIEGSRVVVERILGQGDDVPLERLIVRHGLRVEYAQEALAEATRISTHPPTLGHRRDLRSMPTITVDSASTRDIDDAIAVLPAASDGALRLFVSIADPSEYVRGGTALDGEARRRGTTVYMPGRILPMLPESLSTDRLSLLPGVEREALTVEMRMDAEGCVTSVDVYESLIRSCARLTYDEVDAFAQDGIVSEAMQPARAIMPWLRTAASRLDLARRRRGGIDMARDEASLKLDSGTGTVVGIEKRTNTWAHTMIERLMVATNEAVARWLEERGIPAPYRVHAEPEPARVANLAECAHHFGYEAGFPPVLTPLALAAFEAQIAGTPAENAIRSVMLRALGPARYTVTPAPHFGLAAPRYLHFTSPLRRYADLVVHRTIKAWLQGHRDFVPLDPEVESLARHLNDRTAAAAKAETDRHRMMAAAYMAHHIGETYSAHITRVRPFGLVAQIDATLIEGLIPVESLPAGPWNVDAREIALVGKEETLAVGMRVYVSVRSTDPTRGRIEYERTGLPQAPP